MRLRNLNKNPNKLKIKTNKFEQYAKDQPIKTVEEFMDYLNRRINTKTHHRQSTEVESK